MSFSYLATKGEPEYTVPYSPHVKQESAMDVAFLSDNELSRNIDFCVNVPEIEVCFAIFDINGACSTSPVRQDGRSSTSPVRQDGRSLNEEKLPFLKYMIEVGDTATFPTIHLACSTTEDNEEHFKTEATLFLMQILGVEDKNADFYEAAFRGFVYNTTHKCVFAVFDIRAIPVSGTASTVWATVDELVFERRVWNLAVDAKISDTLRENPILWNLPLHTDFPSALYMIKEKENGVFAIDVTPSKDAPSLFQHGDTIDTYKYGDRYGDMYMFCQKPLFDDGTGSDMKYARYAVFTHGAKYLLEDQYHHAYLDQLTNQHGGYETLPSSDADDMEADADAEVEAEVESVEDVIYFVEDRITKVPTQLWGVRDTSRFVRI